MKKTLILMLVLTMLLALFAGCNSQPNTGENNATQAPATATAAPTSAPTSAATQSPADDSENDPDSSYNFAAGKYTLNNEGFPVEPYEYELPISTTDEVLSFWTNTLTPAFIPEEGYGAIPVNEGMEQLTGINIEYLVIPYESRDTNFMVLLNSDSLPDIMASSIYFIPNSPTKMVEDGYYANIYEYKDYCPNYIYQATKDPNDKKTKEAIFYRSDLIISFYDLFYEAEIVVQR